MKTIIALLAVACIIVLACGMASAAPPTPSPSTVIVGNTASNPVPVSGNVGITGTASVNVTNTVPVSGSVALSGTPNVSISGTPTVNVNSAAPADTTVLMQIPEHATSDLVRALDTSACSSLRIAVANNDPANSLTLIVWDHTTNPTSIALIRTSIAVRGVYATSATFVIDTPPPDTDIYFSGSTSYSANAYCR
jgi:hypothetical protein